jgi:NAD(P)-dependent dehydrogenase (short-subunit alcohol dehydrogenase family)
MTRIALVTGANQGIGYAVVEELAARMDPADVVLLTGRNRSRVEAAASAVPTTGARVEGRVLDVADSTAIEGLAAELGEIDIVVSNAIAPLHPDRPQSTQADEFIAVANDGATAVLRSFGPILRPGGRLVVVASSLGTLGHLDPRLHHLFENATLSEVEQAVADWRGAIHDGTLTDHGWPKWLNVPSKVAQVAAVRAVAAERRTRDLAEGTLVAAVCPGLVDTRASRPWFDDFSMALPAAKSARLVVDLLLNPLDPAHYGELVRFGKVLPWHDGTPPTAQDRLLTV